MLFSCYLRVPSCLEVRVFFERNKTLSFQKKVFSEKFLNVLKTVTIVIVEKSTKKRGQNGPLILKVSSSGGNSNDSDTFYTDRKRTSREGKKSEE